MSNQNNQEIVAKVIDQETKNTFNDIINLVCDLDKTGTVSENIIGEIVLGLKGETFFTEELALTERQKEVLINNMNTFVVNAYNKYKASIKDDDRKKQIVKGLISLIGILCSRSIAQIGEEINRGTVATGRLVIGNCNNKQITVGYSQNSKITLESNVVVISTNVVPVYVNSIISVAKDRGLSSKEILKEVEKLTLTESIDEELLNC